MKKQHTGICAEGLNKEELCKEFLSVGCKGCPYIDCDEEVI